MISIDLVVEHEGWRAALPDLDALIERAVEAALAGRGAAGSLTILLADDAQLAELNAQFRGKDGPTNILSFPPADMPPIPGAAPPLGDLALALETMQREAGAGAVPLSDHLQHLIVHGALHLLGYDHLSDSEAEEMEALETEILSRIGVPDPYAGHV